MNAARLQLAHQFRVRMQCPGDDHQTGGVGIQSMHDAGARQLRKLRCMEQQPVQQRAGPVAGGRMHHQSRAAC